MLRRALRSIAVLGTVISLLALTSVSAFASTTFTLRGGLDGSQSCNASEFHFVINGLDSETLAPAIISVTFRRPNGTTSAVPIPMEKFTGKVAHYTLSVQQVASALGITPAEALSVAVVSGTATVTANNVSYNNFNYSHGPCPPVIPEVPFGAVYPAVGALTLAAGYGLRRLRRREPVSVV